MNTIESLAPTYPDNPARKHTLEFALSSMFCLDSRVDAILSFARRLRRLERLVGGIYVLEEQIRVEHKHYHRWVIIWGEKEFGSKPPPNITLNRRRHVPFASTDKSRGRYKLTCCHRGGVIQGQLRVSDDSLPRCCLLHWCFLCS